MLETGTTSVFYTKTFIRLHLSDMKVVAVLLILGRLAHCNKSNYFPLFITLYLYYARVRIDAITFLNHFSISVLYDVL